MGFDLSRHPCFNDSIRHQYGRIHLPVAPKCNIQCRFCNRKYDCINESRPGVTTTVLSPHQALAYLDRVMERDNRIAVVGIAGPGDPFANAENTMQTLELVRDKYPDMLLCVASNGLNVAPYVEQLAALKVSHVTLTINAVDAEIGSHVYAWVRDKKRVYHGTDAAALLLSRQLEAIKALKDAGLIVKVNTILIPGVNDDHVNDIAATMRDLGVDILNCIPIYPVEGTDFENVTPPSSAVVKRTREEASQYVKQMHHCTRCRADACGLLGDDLTNDIQTLLEEAAAAPMNPDEDRPYVAVATMEGMLVNQHLGEAQRFYVFARDDDWFRLVETRQAPESGAGDDRWKTLAGQLKDCKAILVSGAGDRPRQILEATGLKLIVMEGLIEEALSAVYSGQEIRAPSRPHKCGAACSGKGTGCG